MSYVDDLLAHYERFVQLPWRANLAPAQRVWMAVYPPEHERRLRLHLPEFETATEAGRLRLGADRHHDAFERWMAAHEYRDAYFEDPNC